MKLDSTHKLKFYTKLKNSGISKDKFFKLCFHAFMNNDPSILELIQKKEYLEFVDSEYRAKKLVEDELKKNDRPDASTRYTSLRKLKEYDIEYYLDEE